MATEEKKNVPERGAFPTGEAPPAKKTDKKKEVVAAFVGESGVGKTTIINNLLGFEHDALPITHTNNEPRAPCYIVASKDNDIHIIFTRFTKAEWGNLRSKVASLPDECPKDWRDGKYEYQMAADKEMLRSIYGDDYKLEQLRDEKWESEEVANLLNVPHGSEVTCNGRTYEGVKDAGECIEGLLCSATLLSSVRVEIPFPDTLPKNLVIVEHPSLCGSYVTRHNSLDQLAARADAMFWVIPHDSRCASAMSYSIEGRELAAVVPDLFLNMRFIVSKMDYYDEEESRAFWGPDLKHTATCWWRDGLHRYYRIRKEKQTKIIPADETFPVYFTEFKRGGRLYRRLEPLTDIVADLCTAE
jgi:energy-coupling factor transporter ATP-binding protein EcfA2